jgi:SPP1 gp7 family putative phage head morphogenesis protein
MRSPTDKKRRLDLARAFRKNPRSPAAQRKGARLLRASSRAETRYVRDVVRVMKAVHAGFLASPLIQREEKHARAAGGDGSIRIDARPFPTAMKKRLVGFIRTNVGPAFDRMAKTVNANNAEGLALLGIQPAYVAGLAGVVAHAREDNLRLIANAASDYADQVEDVLTDPDNFGLRAEELEELLVERGNVSVSRAQFIARDQTLKTNAAITRTRMGAAGVARYRWSTSQDERVRPMHAELGRRSDEGETFSFDDPPVTNDDGDTNNPGEDYQCRCVPIPFIPELDEPDTEPGEGDEIPGYPENPEDIPGYGVPDIEE